MGVHKPLTGAQRVARRRAALRAQGLKPRTFWLPDRNSESWKQAALEDSAKLEEWYREHPEAMAWIDAMTEEAWASLPPEEHDY